jgi:hypothetical protein
VCEGAKFGTDSMGVIRALEASFIYVHCTNQEEILGPDLVKKKKPNLPFLPLLIGHP